MRQAGHVAPWRDEKKVKKNIYRAFGGENVKEKGYWEDPGIDWTILKWILKKQDGRTWNEFTWFMIKKSGGLL
jgi:hypothetical protein